MSHDKHENNRPEFIVDNEPYQWHKPTITGAEIRKEASLPDSVQIFMKIPGKPDREIKDDTVVDLRGPGPERFSSQEACSAAG